MLVSMQVSGQWCERWQKIGTGSDWSAPRMNSCNQGTRLDLDGQPRRRSLMCTFTVNFWQVSKGSKGLKIQGYFARSFYDRDGHARAPKGSEKSHCYKVPSYIW